MTPAAVDELPQALNVRVLGNEEAKSTVVLAHGFGCDQKVWDEALPALLDCGSAEGQACRRVVVFDWPGAASTDLIPTPAFYHTFAQLLLSLLQHLRIDSCIFVGHSMSAMVGCIAALLQPAFFRKLILVGASPRYLNAEGYYGGFEREDLDQLYAAMESDFRRWASEFSLAVVGVDAAKEAVRKFEMTLSAMRPDVALAMAKTIFESDFRGVVNDLTAKLLSGHADGDDAASMKVVVLQSRKDIAVPIAVSDYLKRQLGSRATVEILEVDGHLLHLSAAKLFTSALLQYILAE